MEASSKDNFRNVNKAFPQICWLILCSSLIGSYCISNLFIRECKKRYKDNQIHVKSVLLFVFVLFLFGTVVAVFAAVYSTQGRQLIYPLVYLFFIFLLCLRRFRYCLSSQRVNLRNNGAISGETGENKNTEPEQEDPGFLCTAFPGCFIALHQTLWVMIGIITEPFWALPIVTTILMLAFLFYVLSFLFFGIEGWEKKNTINFTLVVAAGMSVLLVQFSFFLIGQQFFDESLISSAIQSALVVIISIWLKSVNGDENNQDSAGNNESSNSVYESVSQSIASDENAEP